MNNISGKLSTIQSQLTYNGNHIKIPDIDKKNIYMGIGLWSAKDGLSIGLPVDIMQMLLSAIPLRSKIIENNPKELPKVIILIADSMAIAEGAKEDQVSQIVMLYKKSLAPLLELLNLTNNTEIILSSELENENKYQETLNLIENHDLLINHKGDTHHYNYIKTQTAITHYMHTHRDVGVKIGWICTDSSKQLNQGACIDLKNWDELKFDRAYGACFPKSTLQCLYARAGMKQRQEKDGGPISVSEGSPYTAYEKDHRYIVQSKKVDIKSICPLQNRVSKQWTNVPQICSELSQLKLVSINILPNDWNCKNNLKLTVSKMLTHWSNIQKDDSIATPKQTKGRDL